MKYVKSLLLHLAFSFSCLCIATSLWSQDSGTTQTTTTTKTTKTTDISVTTDNNDWYTQPWVWIVGAAVFILLLVALLNGSRRRDSVIVDKTVEKDNRPG